ncbi:PAS domain-containing protein [Sphingosinicella sp. BN140058]|uniref:blue-light-activated histidine kinase n=1 Tax=Sphingosinicella sp. BN140058 TaxID=1892855 RepID=UPI0019811EE9|nr:PAS domain-containing protein [Sphingosinicella sp. BN140058]
MSTRVEKQTRFPAEFPDAASPQGLVDGKELAFVAFKRTRMPMVVTDPEQPDNPIVLANQSFLDLTGYSPEEVVGRNCRFLQGPATNADAVRTIREALAAERELTVELLNYRKDGSTFWNELFISPVHDDDGRLLYLFGSCKDVTQRKEANHLKAEEHRLLKEVDHRAKNALALVQGIVRLTSAEDPRTYAESVQGRVEALARAHSILAAGNWREVPLQRVITSGAEPFGRSRISLDGPDVALAAEQVQPLMLVLHEMFSNALKHGALSAESGSVSVRWQTHDDGRLVVDWQEVGGPAPAPDPVPSFGSMLIETTIKRQLDGRAGFVWQHTGLEGRLEFPLGS